MRFPIDGRITYGLPDIFARHSILIVDP